MIRNDSIMESFRVWYYYMPSGQGVFRWYSSIESYPETRSRLSPDASIIMHPTFESAIIKIQSDKAHDMSEGEKLFVQGLKPEEICTLSNEPENPCRSLPGLSNACAPPVIAMQHTSTHDSSYLLPTSVNDCFLKQAMPYQTAGSASFRRTLNSKYFCIWRGNCGVPLFRT